jgi:glycosyltransferase involved in cell wall biosynthesis
MFSFAILTHNESEEYLSKCVSCILAEMQNDEEIVIVDDYSTNEETISYLDKLQHYNSKIHVQQHALNKNFAQQKNFLNSQCKNDWIFNLDADEYMLPGAITWYRQLIDNNPTLQALCLPRKNIVTDITQQYIAEQNWKVCANDKGEMLINFPDYQCRVYRKNAVWHNHVHETIDLQKAYIRPIEDVSIIHIKSFEKQKLQNEFYKTIV